MEDMAVGVQVRKAKESAHQWKKLFEEAHPLPEENKPLFVSGEFKA
jgi:hypothetical protein